MILFVAPVWVSDKKRNQQLREWPTHSVTAFNYRQSKPIVYTAHNETACFMANTPPGSVYRRRLPDRQIDFTTEEGKKRFRTALLEGNAEAFFPLVSQLQTQSHPAFCGLTSLSVVLNALGIDPKRVWAHPWRWFVDYLLDCCMDIAHIKTFGVTMDQLARTARCQGTAVKVIRNPTLEESRELVKTSVRAREDGSFEFLIASYDRGSLGQTGTGHFSPVAAYDEATDSVLVLDVARFKYGPHWIPLPELVDAAKLQDPATGMSRGFMAIRKESDKNGSCRTLSVQTAAPCCEQHPKRTN